MATRKKEPTKTTAKAKATAGAVRPTFAEPDIAANNAIAQRDQLFFKMEEGLNILRVLPQFNGSTTLANKSVLHYGYKSEDGSRGIAPGCTMFHGSGEDCYFCDLVNWLIATEDPQYENYHSRDSKNRITASPKLDVQAYVYNVGTKKWTGPLIVSISATVAASFGKLLTAAVQMEMPFFSDIDQGQGVAITKMKKTPWYETQLTSKVQSLDAIDPKWADKVFRDLREKLKVTVYTREEQKQCAQRTYPQLPWAAIQADIG